MPLGSLWSSSALVICCHAANGPARVLRRSGAEAAETTRKRPRDQAGTFTTEPRTNCIATAPSSLGAGCTARSVSERRKPYAGPAVSERDLGEQGAQAVTHTFVAVVATYEGMSEEEINGLRLLAGLKKKTTLAGTAARFLKECHLAKWVETRNMEQNIAPLVSLVAHEARATNCLPSEPTSTKVRSQLQWLRRWRKRWSVSLGCIAAREHIPPEEGRRKASLIEKFCDGSSFRLVFGSDFLNDRTQNRGHYMAPFWGPRYYFTKEQGPPGGPHF